MRGRGSWARREKDEDGLRLWYHHGEPGGGAERRCLAVLRFQASHFICER
jgi:hypothetical protein